MDSPTYSTVTTWTYDETSLEPVKNYVRNGSDSSDSNNSGNARKGLMNDTVPDVYN